MHVNLCCRCVDKVACNSGQGLYEMGREEMKNMFGAGDGIRLFSQLQKDKSRVCVDIITY